MPHDHSHHTHGHTHGRAEQSLGIAFALNLSFAIIEVIGGLMTNSVAILSDAVHDFGDSCTIGFALYLEKVSKRKQDADYSYGYRRFSLLSALVSSLILLGGSIWMLTRAFSRLLNPEPLHLEGMVGLAALGILVNGYGAYRVSKGHSINEKMVMWHLIEDVAGWVLVLIGTFAMMIWNEPRIDAVLSIALSCWIIFNVFRLLRSNFRILLQGVPQGLSETLIKKSILAVKGVKGVHHQHVWSLDGEHHLFTAHIVVGESTTRAESGNIGLAIKKELQKFSIVEATLEMEFEGISNCDEKEHK